MSKSENLYSAARELIPGGVNSPVRAFTGVGGTPLFIEKADGAYLYDVDGKAYIDYVGSWGPMVLGHNHPAIRNAVIEAAERFWFTSGWPRTGKNDCRCVAGRTVRRRSSSTTRGGDYGNRAAEKLRFIHYLHG